MKPKDGWYLIDVHGSSETCYAHHAVVWVDESVRRLIWRCREAIDALVAGNRRSTDKGWGSVTMHFNCAGVVLSELPEELDRCATLSGDQPVWLRWSVLPDEWYCAPYYWRAECQGWLVNSGAPGNVYFTALDHYSDARVEGDVTGLFSLKKPERKR